MQFKLSNRFVIHCYQLLHSIHKLSVYKTVQNKTRVIKQGLQKKTEG